MNQVISIIIPHYNSWDKLGRLLDSIGEQEFIQVIVVDDCSPEENKVFCESDYKNVEFYSLSVNRGAGACRNYGLKHATGEWVLFADADDFFVDNYFLLLKKHIKSTADIIFFVPTSVYEGETRVGTRHLDYEKLILDYHQSRDKTTENKLRYRFNSPCSKMIRKKIIDENQISFEEVKVSNDVLFSVKCGYYAKGLLIEEVPIYCITQGMRSLTTKKDFISIYTRLGEMVKTYKFLRQFLCEKEIKQLELRGGMYLTWAILEKYTIKQFCKMLYLIISNRIYIWDSKFISKAIAEIYKRGNKPNG